MAMNVMRRKLETRFALDEDILKERNGEIIDLGIKNHGLHMTS